MVLYVENPRFYQKNPRTHEHILASSQNRKIHMQKWILILYTSNEQYEKELRKECQP